MRFTTIWYVRPAKAQTSLHIHADWSEPLLVAWIFYDCLTTDQTSFEVSKLKRRLHRLVCRLLWIYTFQNTTLLEITCHGSFWYLLHMPATRLWCACGKAQSFQNLVSSHTHRRDIQSWDIIICHLVMLPFNTVDSEIFIFANSVKRHICNI